MILLSKRIDLKGLMLQVEIDWCSPICARGYYIYSRWFYNIFKPNVNVTALTDEEIDVEVHVILPSFKKPASAYVWIRKGERFVHNFYLNFYYNESFLLLFIWKISNRILLLLETEVVRAE